MIPSGSYCRVGTEKKQIFFHRQQVVNCCRLAVDLCPGSRVRLCRRQQEKIPGKPEAEYVFVDLKSDTGTHIQETLNPVS